MDQLPTDVIAVCKEHEPQPDPTLINRKPSWFIGKFVKVGFPIKGRQANEFVWIKITRCKNEILVGFVDGVDAAELVDGQRVSVRIAQVCDVLNPNQKPKPQKKGKAQCTRSLSKTGRLLGSVCVIAPTSTITVPSGFPSETPTGPAPRG